MSAIHARAVLVLPLLLGASPCAAAVLHVYGPEGTPSERRALAVLERDDGGCVDLGGAALRSPDDGVDVAVGDSVGPCARWIRISASPPRDEVRLDALADGVAHSRVVAMGSERRLEVSVTRRGDRVLVRVSGAPDGDPVHVVARWPDGETELEAHDGAWRGAVPAGALVGIVARSSALTGAAASTPSRGSGPEVVILPSELGVPIGGSPRTAAFVVVTDRRGRLSRNVPLRIESERGRLRRLEWLEPGLASVRLSADTLVPSIDLAVEVGDVRAQRTLAVTTGWPAAATIQVPDTVEAGAPFEVAGTFTDVEGAASDARTVIRCGGSILETSDGPVSCVAPADVDAVTVTAAVEIDGRLVPVASRSVAVVRPEPATAASAPPVEPPPSTLPVVPPPALRRWSVAVGPHGGVDTWGRGSGGALARVAYALTDLVALGAALRYGATPYRATSDDARVSPVEGVRHATDLAVEGALRGDLGGFALGGWIGAGITWVEDAGAVGEGGFQDRTLAPILVGGAGPSFTLADAVRLDAVLAVRVPLAVLWNEAPVRFFAEVSLALLP